MFKTVNSVLTDVATLSSGITGTAVNAVLLVDDSILLARDQVAIWRLTKANELKTLGLEPTKSASSVSSATTEDPVSVIITSSQG